MKFWQVLFGLIDTNMIENFRLDFRKFMFAEIAIEVS